MTNLFGTVESQPFEVFYNPHLTFVEQPRSKMVIPGGTALFQVALTGEQPMSFQWYKDAVAMNGATNASLRIFDVHEKDLGLYRVKVSNSIEAVNSDAASLAFWPVLRVSNLNDSGFDSLRWAIEQANLTPEAELRTIVSSNVGVIRLRNELVIRSRVQIESHSTSLTISGGAATRLLRIESNALAQVLNFVLVDGKAPAGEAGGAIWSGGRLDLTDCSLVNHTAALGGGIYSSGDMVLRNCVFSNNVAQGENGQAGNGPGGGGGGLGGAIYSAGGEATLTNVILHANKARGGNGGEFKEYAGTGYAEPGKGGNEGTNTTGTGNIPFGVGGGGGFQTSYISPGRPPTLYHLHNPGHPAGFGGGGGGAHGGSSTVFSGDFHFGPGSEPGFGGGVAYAPGAGGGAGLGGAIFVQGGTVRLVNSRVAANSSTGGEGITNGLGIGGGIFVHAGIVRIGQSSVFGNSSQLSSDFYGPIVSEGGNVFSTLPEGPNASDQVGMHLLVSIRNLNIELKWPMLVQTYALERSSSILGSQWDREPSPPTVMDDHFIVSTSANLAAEFFRLRQTGTGTNETTSSVAAPKSLSGRIIKLRNLEPIPSPEVLTFFNPTNFVSDRTSGAGGTYTYNASGDLATLHLNYSNPKEIEGLSDDLSFYFVKETSGIFRGNRNFLNYNMATIGTFELPP